MVNIYLFTFESRENSLREGFWSYETQSHLLADRQFQFVTLHQDLSGIFITRQRREYSNSMIWMVFVMRRDF